MVDFLYLDGASVSITTLYLWTLRAYKTWATNLSSLKIAMGH